MYGVGDKIETGYTSCFTPAFQIKLTGRVGAVISLDFLEHVVNVETWVQEIYKELEPGGLFFAQNAFACGSGPDGSIPCHLQINDRFVNDWEPLLARVGFEQLSSNWYRKP
jgi:hypothetical protein